MKTEKQTFCDPHSPWQKGGIENMNGRLRRYLPLKVKEWKGDLIFLHEVAAGSADRSYGIHVARLAGIPASVITRAADILHQLEKEQRSAPKLAESLPLFSYMQPALPQPKNHAVFEEIKNISPDNLTPKEALEMLYKLRGMVE